MDLAFAKGIKIKAFPILARAVQTELSHEVPFQAAFSVGKKRFRRAVDRNRIKRLMREAWRVEKRRSPKIGNPTRPNGPWCSSLWGTRFPPSPIAST